MAPVVETVEIAKSPQEVFAYLDDLSRHGEWQEQIESVELLTEGPTRVGSRAVDTRRVPGGRRKITYEITEHDPPRRAAFRGLDGPKRHIEVSAFPLIGQTEQPLGAVAMFWELRVPSGTGAHDESNPLGN